MGHMIGSSTQESFNIWTLSGASIFLAHFNLMWVPGYKKVTSPQEVFVKVKGLGERWSNI